MDRKPVALHTNLLKEFVTYNQINNYQDHVSKLHTAMHERMAEGSDYLGWLDYPLEDHSEMLKTIQNVTDEIKKNADVLIVIGVGGSYLGARAVQDALAPYFGPKSDGVEVIYAGQNMSGAYLKQLLSYIRDKEIYVNVISKSGTTTEPAIAFRLIRDYMEARYGEESSERIIVTTDRKKGALRELADEKDYRSFVIADDIGGRYSVLTPVGLLPLCAAGCNISELMRGAKRAAFDLQSENLSDNAAYEYAVIRNILYSKGYTMELLASFEPSLKNFHEWWKQLFGESEGKGKKGIFPAAVSYSTDLHSIGQYIQDGHRFLFETILHFDQVEDDMEIPFMEDDRDGLNYLVDKTVNEINCLSKEGTAIAHVDGGVPVVKLNVNVLDEYHIGYLIYFFMKSCAMSAYLLGVNPFDQPGVEAYKNNMFALLNKPGYEDQHKSLKERMEELDENKEEVASE